MQFLLATFHKHWKLNGVLSWPNNTLTQIIDYDSPQWLQCHQVSSEETEIHEMLFGHFSSQKQTPNNPRLWYKARLTLDSLLATGAINNFWSNSNPWRKISLSWSLVWPEANFALTVFKRTAVRPYRILQYRIPLINWKDIQERNGFGRFLKQPHDRPKKSTLILSEFVLNSIDDRRPQKFLPIIDIPNKLSGTDPTSRIKRTNV